MNATSWQGPPTDVLGQVVPAARILARADRAVIALQQLTAYPQGCVLSLRLALRRGPLDGAAWEALLGGPFAGGPGSAGAGGLGVGVRFPDGVRATTVDHPIRGWGRATDRPEPPLLVEIGGESSSDDAEFDGVQRLWLWPLPAGRFELVVEWREVGIAPAATVIDGTAVAEAGERALPLWDPPAEH